MNWEIFFQGFLFALMLQILRPELKVTNWRWWALILIFGSMLSVGLPITHTT